MRILLPKHDDEKYIRKYAFLPIRLAKNYGSNDTIILWLENYIVHSRYNGRMWVPIRFILIPSPEYDEFLKKDGKDKWDSENEKPSTQIKKH